MNIVEAMQHAENGKLITNQFLKYVGNHILKYMGNGIFYEYQTINGKAIYKYVVREFSFRYIIDNSWEVVPNIYFQEPENGLIK